MCESCWLLPLPLVPLLKLLTRDRALSEAEVGRPLEGDKQELSGSAGGGSPPPAPPPPPSVPTSALCLQRHHLPEPRTPPQAGSSWGQACHRMSPRCPCSLRQQHHVRVPAPQTQTQPSAALEPEEQRSRWCALQADPENRVPVTAAGEPQRTSPCAAAAPPACGWRGAGAPRLTEQTAPAGRNGTNKPGLV